MTTDASQVRPLVLTTCDAFDVFPPEQFGYLKLVGRLRPLAWLIGQAMRLSFSRNLPITYGRLANTPIPKELTADWTRPMRTDRAVRRDVRKLLRSLEPTDTEAAGAAVAEFDRPTLIVWGRNDRFLPPLLAETLPDARIEWVDDTSTFVPLDQPELLAELITAHVSPTT